MPVLNKTVVNANQLENDIRSGKNSPWLQFDIMPSVLSDIFTIAKVTKIVKIGGGMATHWTIHIRMRSMNINGIRNNFHLNKNRNRPEEAIR
jgi:hypothetical protein